MGFYLLPHAPISRQLDTILRQSIEHGLMAFYDDYSNHLYKLLFHPISDSGDDNENSAITFKELHRYFYFYYFGVTIATLVFCIEILFSSCK